MSLPEACGPHFKVSLLSMLLHSPPEACRHRRGDSGPWWAGEEDEKDGEEETADAWELFQGIALRRGGEIRRRRLGSDKQKKMQHAKNPCICAEMCTTRAHV